MKQLKIFLAILFVFSITTSTATAAHSYGSGKGHDSFSNHFQYNDPYRPCTDCSSCSGGSCNNCLDGNYGCSDNNCATCPGGDCQCNGINNNPGAVDSTNSPMNPPADTTGATTYRLCSNNVCNIGGDGQVLTLTNYNNAKNPTYDQLLSFLKTDLTDAQPYTSQYVCSDFARTLHNNAEAAGIKCAWVGCSFTKGVGHAFNEFQTTDRGTVYIDCTGVPGGETDQDKILNCIVGKPLSAQYLFRSGNIADMGTVKKIEVFW